MLALAAVVGAFLLPDAWRALQAQVRGADELSLNFGWASLLEHLANLWLIALLAASRRPGAKPCAAHSKALARTTLQCGDVVDAAIFCNWARCVWVTRNAGAVTGISKDHRTISQREHYWGEAPLVLANQEGDQVDRSEPNTDKSDKSVTMPRIEHSHSRAAP